MALVPWRFCILVVDLSSPMHPISHPRCGISLFAVHEMVSLRHSDPSADSQRLDGHGTLLVVAVSVVGGNSYRLVVMPKT